MKRNDFITRVFNPIYNLSVDSNTDRSSPSSVVIQYDPESEEPNDDRLTYGPSDLGLLFMILSGGANADKSLRANNEEVKDYHALAKVALSLVKPWHSSSIHFAQTIHLMLYNRYAHLSLVAILKFHTI
jgi:hypothetical protein